MASNGISSTGALVRFSYQTRSIANSAEITNNGNTVMSYTGLLPSPTIPNRNVKRKPRISVDPTISMLFTSPWLSVKRDADRP